MALLGRHRRRQSADIWPGFVDALASLLMVIIFVVMVFALAQFFMGQALSGRDQALARLTRELAELGEMLNLERASNNDLRATVAQLSAELQSSQGARESLQRQLGKADADTDKLARLENDVAALEALRAELEKQIAEMGAKLGESEGSLREERRLSEEARAQAALLNSQLAALRQEMARIAAALDASEQLAKDQKVQIAALGNRLNQALASKVEELSKYRSEFFGRLRQVLGNHPGIRVEGDRFVFQSELLFPSGSDEMAPAGREQIARLAKTLNALAQEIPSDINWVLRVDGHTDRIPINTPRFPSNWELSTARAISVVRFLVDEGIAPDRLAATGFGEYQPLEKTGAPAALAKNRRIELRLDQK